MKKTLTFVLIVALIVMAGCTAQATPAPTEAPATKAPATDAPTEAPTEEAKSIVLGDIGNDPGARQTGRQVHTNLRRTQKEVSCSK